jgi:G3E family GTPase
MEPAMAARPVPFTVIGGFLGAGKTTLLNRLLRDSAGLRLAVLVNDFGAINIDSRLIASEAADVVELTNGCVCCQIGDDLTSALIRVLEAPRPFDAVVVEASGVSDPWRIAQFGRADPALALSSVVVLVDAGSVVAHARDPLLADTLERQIRAADLIVVNKTDLASPDERAAAHEWIGSVASQTPRIETVDSGVPMALLRALTLDDVLATARDAAKDPAKSHRNIHAAVHSGTGHHGEIFDTWACRQPRALLLATLRTWMNGTPGGILRLKGLLQTADAGWVEIQFAGRHGSVRGAVPPPAGAAIVAIGLQGQLPTQNLDEFFRTTGADRRPGAESPLDRLSAPQLRQVTDHRQK